jgi:hypothetical protein
MLPAPMSLPSDMYPNEVPTKSYPLLSGHSFFGYSPFAPPSNVPLFFQQQQSSVIVPDCKILQTKDNNQQQQQQAHQLFSQHPYLKGLHQHSNNRPATTIKSEPMDTEISSKPSWSKVVAGERPTANSFPVLSNSSSAYQATDDEAVEDMMSCDLNSAISKELRPIVLSPSKPGCSNAKYLTDSISYIASSMEDSTSNENCSIARPYTVVKITNVCNLLQS